MNHLLFYVKENQISPNYSSLNFFIFLSLQFSDIKKFIFLFSGTERHTKLKLGPHMNSRLMYHAYLNRVAGIYLFLYFFNFLSLKFQNIKFWSHFSVRHTKLKLDTHMGKGLCTPKYKQPEYTCSFIFLLFFYLSNWKRLKSCIYKIVSTYLWWLCELYSLSAIFFTVFIVWWPRKLGHSHQNLINSFTYPNDTIHKVWPESIIWFKR